MIIIINYNVNINDHYDLGSKNSDEHNCSTNDRGGYKSNAITIEIKFSCFLFCLLLFVWLVCCFSVVVVFLFLVCSFACFLLWGWKSLSEKNRVENIQTQPAFSVEATLAEDHLAKPVPWILRSFNFWVRDLTWAYKLFLANGVQYYSQTHAIFSIHSSTQFVATTWKVTIKKFRC